MSVDLQKEGLVLPYNGFVPKIGREVFLAPGSIVVGDIEIGDEANLWNCMRSACCSRRCSRRRR